MAIDEAVLADLHVHTAASDGRLQLNEVPAAARDAGLSLVALTDHEQPHPELDEPLQQCDGIWLVRGIELKVTLPAGNQIDLLGYGVRETPELSSLIERLQQDRMERAERIIDLVEERLSISLALTPHRGIGRPHIARAIAAHPETDCDTNGAFAAYIGDDSPCYVPRSVPSLEEALPPLTAACGLISVAHPFRYDRLAPALALARDVGAIERWYPYDHPVDTTELDHVIETAGLLATGGSDAHEYTLGHAGLNSTALRRFLEATGGPDWVRSVCS